MAKQHPKEVYLEAVVAARQIQRQQENMKTMRLKMDHDKRRPQIQRRALVYKPTPPDRFQQYVAAMEGMKHNPLDA